MTPQPSVPDWIESISTALAFIAAGIAAWYARRLLGIEHQRDQEVSSEKRQEQARLVSAWIESRSLATGLSTAGTHSSLVHREIIIRSISEQPIYDLAVKLTGDPKDPNNPAQIGRPFPVFPPATRETIDITRLKFDGDENDLRTVLTFRDAAGRRWTREPDGTLTEHDRPV